MCYVCLTFTINNFANCFVTSCTKKSRKQMATRNGNTLKKINTNTVYKILNRNMMSQMSDIHMTVFTKST